MGGRSTDKTLAGGESMWGWGWEMFAGRRREMLVSRRNPEMLMGRVGPLRFCLPRFSGAHRKYVFSGTKREGKIPNSFKSCKFMHLLYVFGNHKLIVILAPTVFFSLSRAIGGLDFFKRNLSSEFQYKDSSILASDTR